MLTMHTPVMLRDAVDFLVTDPAGCYVDGTFGRGGHAREILDRLGPAGRLLAIDRDPAAIAAAQAFCSDSRFTIEHASFAELARVLDRCGIHSGVHGVLLDLGVSSPQLDEPGRGFSFLHDGPLDMRMDPSTGRSAAEWLGRARADEIERVLRDYGEERFARRIAAWIVRERAHVPIHTTGQLAQIVARANPAWEQGKHPATRAFQAIRIFINGELEALAAGLEQAVAALRPGGRLVVISFHSLEDRIVKRFMRDASRHGAPHGIPVAAVPTLARIGRAIRPAQAEVAANPRARSAVLRVAERLGTDGRAA